MFRLRPELLGYARHVEPLIVNSTEEDLRTTFARVPRGTILLGASALVDSFSAILFLFFFSSRSLSRSSLGGGLHEMRFFRVRD